MEKLNEEAGLVTQVTNTLVRLGALKTASATIDAVVIEAIKAFQQDRGLIISGELNEVTLRALEEARWKLGDRVLNYNPQQLIRGDDVATLQTRLNEMGFNCGRADGLFGPKTDSGVKDFQKSVGGKVDGLCGPATILSLMRLAKTVSGGSPAALRDSANRASRGPALANKVVVLDPSSEEADAEICFDIAQRVEGRLIALGVTVFLTRSSSAKPTELERIKLANSAGADLVISLHTDDLKSEKASGVATYFYGNDVHGEQSVVGERFAAIVQRELTARTDLINCRTHPKTWEVLRLTKAPAVRMDLGYISNPGDRARLIDPTFREVVVESILVAIQRLYLSTENDAKTGTLRLSDLRRAGVRKA